MGLPRDILITEFELRFKVVPAFEEPALGRHDLRLVGDASLVKILERHPRLRRAKGIAVEIETAHLSAIWLISQSLRRGDGIARVKTSERSWTVFLFRSLQWSFLGGLRLCDSVWRRLVIGRLRSRALGDGKAENTQHQTSNRKDYFEVRWHDKPPSWMACCSTLDSTLGVTSGATL